MAAACSKQYEQGDVVHGRVTKVVTFGAFVEILPGVEGLVHISELAAHHVENPREVVAQGQEAPVKIIEIDAERRRLSLSIKRVEAEDEVRPPIDMAGAPGTTPIAAPIGPQEPTTEPREFELSDDVFGDEISGQDEDEAAEGESEPAAPMLELAEDVESDAAADLEAVADEPEAAVADEVEAEAPPVEVEAEPEAAEPEPEPEAAEPEAAEPEAVEVEAAEPEAVEVEAAEPEAVSRSTAPPSPRPQRTLSPRPPSPRSRQRNRRRATTAPRGGCSSA